MTKSTITAVALATMFLWGLLSPSEATAQENVLAELYGRGVHAYYAGQYLEAQQYLTSAIDNGLTDPRAYYFRGILANAQGRTYDAENDWEEGARLEATGSTNVAIGSSLSRFQGADRLKLEEIRRTARLQAMSGAPTRSQIRQNEIQSAQPPVAASAAARPRVPASSMPVAPPPTPPAADNPFADDAGLAGGQPRVENDDALADAMKPIQGNAAAPAGGAAAAPDATAGAGDAADPFGGAADAAADPFGGDAGADPFGGSGDAGAMEDPFGGSDPFGGN